MDTKWIQNFDTIATTEDRKMALNIVESALDSITTEKIIQSSIQLTGNILLVQGETFDLSKFKKIKVIGFGKASCEAAHALEKIMGPKINEGAVIGLNAIKCDYIETFAGSHPKPSFINIEAGRKIFETGSGSTADDLVIVIVSGGGSAMLCSSEGECDQEIKLYDAFVNRGENIIELNTIRKHISSLKGGGLAKLLYPATVIGLIFSDVAGNHFEDVASGPTYKDLTTVADAQKIVEKYNLGTFELVETTKEDTFFKNVKNFVLVSNRTALDAMKKKAENLGFAVEIVSSELFDGTDEAVQKIIAARKPGTVILAGGETRVPDGDKTKGSGGRCLFMGLNALDMVGDDSVFIPFASDGIDNSLAAGVIVDRETSAKAKNLGLDKTDYIKHFDSYVFFEKTGDIIFTGPTNANVSDLMILLTHKQSLQPMQKDMQTNMHTKSQIVATIGPSSQDKDILKQMILNGMAVARLNFSWGSLEEHAQYIEHIRAAANEVGVKVLIMQDLSGPRVQNVSGHMFNVNAKETITSKDLIDLQFGLDQNVDYVAMSFVGSAQDIVELKSIITKAGKKTPVIAKIEREIGVTNIDEIIAVSDAIMIARGDLGNDVPIEKIPFIERMILEKCKIAGKPVITATQMMLSMVSSEIPTRAEVTDVAYAIMNGSDAVMLSEETANGKYPIQAVEMMEKIIAEAELHLKGDALFNHLT